MSGLYNKYNVYNAETGEEVTDCFVLRLKDPVARQALRVYAAGSSVELARDIWAWLERLGFAGGK